MALYIQVRGLQWEVLQTCIEFKFVWIWKMCKVHYWIDSWKRSNVYCHLSAWKQMVLARNSANQISIKTSSAAFLWPNSLFIG